MLSLIKLELKKFKIKGNILGALICNICILGFICLLFFTDLTDGNTDFDSYKMVFEIIGQFVNVTFIVFAGFLICKYIIEEYKTKTINILFTYPINRRKIMISKMIIISSFTFLSMVLSSIFVFSGFYFIQYITNTTIEAITFKFILQQPINILLNAFANSIIALIPLYFGLRKKSTPITLVTSFLIIMFLYSGNKDFQLSSIIAVLIAFMIAGISIAYLTIRDIDKKDLEV